MTENIHLRVTKSKKAEMMAQAQKEGLSMTALIIAAVNDRISRETNHNVPESLGGLRK